MNQKHAKPPNWNELANHFPAIRRQHGVLFCYGDTIYNPDNVKIPPQIIAHEAVHSRYQGKEPDLWWAQYMISRSFRLEEEVLAHLAELTYLKEHAVSRQQRRAAMGKIAERLTNPIYRFHISKKEARALLAP